MAEVALGQKAPQTEPIFERHNTHTRKDLFLSSIFFPFSSLGCVFHASDLEMHSTECGVWEAEAL